MKVNFSWNNLKKGFIALAPMAGITDSPFREVCRSYGADVVFTEFVHVRGVAARNEKTLKLLNYKDEERPVIAQIFGKEPEYFHKAAKVIEELGFDGVDINMGCPARKVKEHGSGSALLKDLNLAKEIVIATKEAVSLPVSVKTRLGTNEYEGLAFTQGLVEAGADLLTIHGRTVGQQFGGIADLDAIADIAKSVNIPVIGNGDVVDYSSYRKMMETGCFGVMIGRGAYGNPWIFKSIKDRKDYAPSIEELKKEILHHASLVENFLDGDFLPFRKHLAWYVKGLQNARSIRAELVQINNYSDILKIIEKL